MENQVKNDKKPSTKTFSVARYYFPSLFRAEADKSFLQDIRQSPFLQEEDFEFALGDFIDDRVDTLDILKATFGRSRKGQLGEFYDKETHEFKKRSLPDHVEHKIEILIYHPKHLIFIEKNGLLRAEKLISVLRGIYRKNKRISDIQIDFVVDEKDVYKEISKWQTIRKVVFNKLRPSNPSSDDTFAWVEEKLKETGSANTKMEFQAPDALSGGSKGLDPDSQLIKESLALSAHGYGDARFEGVQDGKMKKVETKKFQRTVTVNFFEAGGVKQIIDAINEVGNEEA